MAKASKKSNAAKIRDFLTTYPDAPPASVAEKFGVTRQNVYVIRSNMKKKLAAELKPVNIDVVHKTFDPTTLTVSSLPVFNPVDMVNRPPHYTDGGMEVIDFIEAKKLDYHLGNVVKYVSRSGKKVNALEDLKKARWYLDRAIEHREVSSTSPV